jgi:hypothetical protein
MSVNRIKQIIAIFLFLFSLYSLYMLRYTPWFDTHRIPLLDDFKLYIIFISFLISSIYFFKENIVDDILFIEYGETLETKDYIFSEFSKEFDLKSQIRTDDYIIFKRNTFLGFKQQVLICFDNEGYYIAVKYLFIDFGENVRLLKKIESRFYYLLENKN